MRNVYAEFLALLPSRPLMVGEVLSVQGGVAVVEVPGGGRMQARGEAAVGDRVYVCDGAIQGPAPMLTYSAGEV